MCCALAGAASAAPLLESTQAAMGALSIALLACCWLLEAAPLPSCCCSPLLACAPSAWSCDWLAGAEGMLLLL